MLVNVGLVTQLNVPKHLSKQEETVRSGYRQPQGQSFCRHAILWPACQWWRRWRRAWQLGGKRMVELWRTGWRSKGESGSCSLVSTVWSGGLRGTTSRSSCWTSQQTGTKSQEEGGRWLSLMLLLISWTLHKWSFDNLIYLQVHNDLSDAAQHSDEIKDVPRIPKIVLCGVKKRI